MKRFTTLMTAIICISIIFTGCGKNTKREQEFYDAVLYSQELLDILADDIYDNWYDCIYDDLYSGNINVAVADALSENEDNIEKIEANDKKIKALYSEIKDGDLKEEAKDVMNSYNDYYALVMEVSGSFKSYSEEKEKYKKELSSSLRDFSIEL